MPGPIRYLRGAPVAGGVVVAVVLGTGGCTPRLEWEAPVEARDSYGALAGVEVAVAGRFVGVTNAAGRLVIPLEIEPGARVRIEARDPDPLGARLVRPAAADIVVPSFWAWFAGAGFSGRSRLPETRLLLESFAAASAGGETEGGAEGAHDGLEDALASNEDERAGTTAGPRTRREAMEPTKTRESNLGDSAMEGTETAEKGTPPGAHGAGDEGATRAAHAATSDPAAHPAATERAADPAAEPAAHAVASGGMSGAGARASGANPTGATATGVPLSSVPAPGAREDAGGERGGAGRAGAQGGLPLPRIAPPLGPKSLVVEVYSHGKPLRGAEVYFVRRASGRIVRLGETDEKGVLESDHPAGLLGETLLVRHACCVSLQRPLPAAASGSSPSSRIGTSPAAVAAAPPRTVRVDLAAGVSHDFVAVETAYGVPRTVEKIAFGTGGRTLDVTGPTGLALISGKNLPAGLAAIDVSAPEALPPRRAVAFEVKATSEERPFLVHVARSLPRAPAVGFVEMVKGEVVHAESHLQGEPLYRRARRDFLSRFIQETVLRPLIFQEVKRLAEAAGLDPGRVARRGWDMGPLTAEIDFLAVLEPLPGGTGLGARVVDADGGTVWRGVFPYDGHTPPEAAGRAAYEGVLRALPFEFAVARTEPATLAVGKEARGLVPGDAMVRVGSLSPAGWEGGAEACEGALARDGVTLTFATDCAPSVAVGDVFARKGGARISRKDVTTPGP